MRSNVPTCDVILKGGIGLENLQKFLKNHDFLVLRVHKNDPMAVVLRYVESVNFNMRANF